MCHNLACTLHVGNACSGQASCAHCIHLIQQSLVLLHFTQNANEGIQEARNKEGETGHVPRHVSETHYTGTEGGMEAGIRVVRQWHVHAGGCSAGCKMCSAALTL